MTLRRRPRPRRGDKPSSAARSKSLHRRRRMYLGVIADDFTGASDIANTLAKGGLATTQFFGLPAAGAPSVCDAGVVSLKTRSIDADDAVRQSLEALTWLQAQGCRQFVFKYCSTFDSTPRGNIGPVGEALAAALGERRGRGPT